VSNWNTQKIKTLKKRWADITSDRNVSDHALASWAQRAIKVLPDGEFQDFCTSQDGLGRHPNTARSYERMAQALDTVPESDVWSAVGWDGTRLLSRIEKKRERNAVTRWVVTQAKRQPVTETALENRIKEKAPSYKAAGGGGGGGGGGGNGPSKVALARDVERLKHKNLTLTARFDELVGDFTRVVAKYPIIKNDLSAGTISTLGITGGQLPKVKSA